MTRYFKDFVEGEIRMSPGRTLTETDVVNFVGLSGDYNALHTDHAEAAAGPFGAPIAHGLLTLVTSAGLLEREGGVDGSAIAMLGVEWRFQRPVFFGDTIRVRSALSSKRLTSKPGRGIIVREIEVVNQRGETVQQGRFTTQVKTQDAATTTT